MRITVQPPIRVTGKVVDAAGQPVTGGFVKPPSGRGDQGFGGIGMDGAFVTAVKASGDYRVYVSTGQRALADPDYLKANAKNSRSAEDPQ